jgi:hypothetical protein
MRAQSGRRASEEGQVLALFAISMTALIALAALLFTGAQGVVARRELQNTVDAAALAASNLLVVQNGCSSNPGSGGAPRTAIVTAARNSVAENMPAYDLSQVEVSCPPIAEYNNYAVRVAIKGTGPSFFGGEAISTAASATSVNGQASKGRYSVALLNESNPKWKQSGNGCSSYTVNGGIVVTYEGSIMVNSTCTRVIDASAAVKAQNSGFRMNLINGAFMRIGGEYSANTAGKILPDPMQNSRPLLPDPLSGLIRPCSSADTVGCLGPGLLPAKSAASSGTGLCRLLNADPCILTPGTYNGISASVNPRTILLRPGVYFFRGNGLNVGAQGRVVSIPSASALSDTAARLRYTTLDQATTVANWQADCPPPVATNTCGVLIYTAPGNSGVWQLNSDLIKVNAGGTLLLRAYNPDYDSLGNGPTFQSYRNLVVWQARTPEPAPNKAQPPLAMGGGACSILSGTVYAPGALVDFGGGSCGSGGSADERATLQFIAWDLTLSGSNNFYFAYQAEAFTTPTDYGLVE